jgi:hypothetical protein
MSAHASGISLTEVAAIPVIDTAVIVSSGVVANATAAAAIPAKVGQTAFLSGFQVMAAGATAASSVAFAITGLASGTITYSYTFPAGAGVPATPFVVEFPVALKASALNTAITLTLPAGGSGNLAASVTAMGFYL